MPAAELSRVVFRSFLRWAKAADGVPFSLRSADVAAVLPTLEADFLLEDARAVAKLARSGFRGHQELQDATEVSEALEAGLKGLRLLNSYYTRHIEELRREREVHSDRSGVEFSVGQVFQHKQFGYRAVIYGWDPHCAHEKAWAEALNLDHTQPFYKSLPDEDDCQRVFGSVRITKYVAQENVMPVTVPRRVTHRALEEYFSAYSLANMRYVPRRQLQFTYPDDYEAADAVSCREDTNILRLGDPKDASLRSHYPEWLKTQTLRVDRGPSEPD